MAKRKKRSSDSPPSKSKGTDQRVIRQTATLIVVVIFSFLIVSVFNAGGSLGNIFYRGFRAILGELSPVVAVILVWIALRRMFPKRIGYRLPVFLGCILLLICLTALFTHYGIGIGGGYLGSLTYHGLSSVIGGLTAQLILFVGSFVSLMLIFNKALMPFLKHEEEEGEEEAQSTETSTVRVVGEIQPSGVKGLFRQRSIKPEVVTSSVPVRSIPSRAPGSPDWTYPPLTLFQLVDMKPQAGNIQKRMETIQKTLRDFGMEVTMTDVNVGPTVTQYTLRPADGVKLNQITARQDDLALALAAQSLRVEAPIPGKGAVGIELPNDKKAAVGLREILESKEFRAAGSKLALALGRDAAGDPAIADLARMPHALIAGATGSGKSVCINSIIVTLLTNNSPDELRLILVDPKRVELTGYNGIPHLLTPVITEAKDTVAALAYCVGEMERRYKLFANGGKRNIDQYNAEPDLGEGRLPYIVVIIDELADLMLVAAREVEGSIVRLAQMARAVGIHLIVATQRPSVDVITGLIKANIPTRIAFAVASQIDSRTILDVSGAEKLLGYGDMLYISTEVPRPRRVQGVYVPEKELTSVIAHIRQQEPNDRYNPAVLESRIESRLGSSRENGEVDDELFDEACRVVRQYDKASTTLLQTRLSIGYARAARLMTIMEDQGIIGPSNGSKPREVYGATAPGSEFAEVAPVAERDYNEM